MINVNINGIDVQVMEGTTIFQACKEIGIYVPTLCYLNLEGFDICNQTSSCRVCVVEVVGRRNLVTSCSELCTDNMIIRTDTVRAVNARRTNTELLLSNHPKECLTCAKNLDCDLQSLAHKLGVREIHYEGKRMEFDIDYSSRSLVRDPNKCIMCRRCETMCNKIQTVGALSALDRGFDSVVSCAFHMNMIDSSCTFCGQCVAVCPTGALTEVSEVSRVWSALSNPNKFVVVQVAPAIRVTIGEMFGMEPGTIATGKIPTVLRQLGFDAVFDTSWGADLTVMEEASELLHRLEHNGTIPMLTSCCPAWVKFIEHQFPDMLDIPSTCKSPQTMTGALIKSYYAKQMNINPKDIVVVSVMPCLAKKAEAARVELSKDSNQDVDFVITTREFGQMIKEIGIDFNKVEESDFDSLMGESTGAATIFGTTGGVIEATVRTAYEWITGEELENVEFTQLRGLKGIREATVKIGDMDVKIGIAHGLGNARKLLEGIRSGEYNFHAIEIMACPGGCIGGGGQPYHHGDIEILKKRQKALYTEDAGKKRRKSHENQMVLKLYEDYLGKPYGELAHELLHTQYIPRERI